jgi:glycosyltransferase involved in cell wall biosynthesis
LCPNGRFYTQGNVCERCKYGNTVHAVRFKCYKDSRSLSALYALTIGVHRQWKTFDAIDCFIAPTEFPAQKLVESGLVPREKISILGNFLLDPLPAAGSFEHREPYVAFLGRLLPEKGAETVVKAMAGLPGLGLKIMGGGVQTDALKAMVRDQQLSKVEFLGHVVGEEKYDILRRATATVVPSLCYETFSLAALESLAVGTPVVASNRGSLPFVVEKDQSGLLFRAGDVADLQAKLTWLVEHPSVALQYGCHARKSVEERFTAALHYEKLMDIYNVVIH